MAAFRTRRHHRRALRRTVALAFAVMMLASAAPAAAQLPVVNAAPMFGRVDRSVHGVPLRVRGYVADDCIRSNSRACR